MFIKFFFENMYVNLFRIFFYFFLCYVFLVFIFVLMNNDVFVFCRSMDEGKIGILKLMEVD